MILEHKKLSNLLDSNECRNLFNYALNCKGTGDAQVSKSESFYGDKNFIEIHKKLLKTIEDVVGEKLYPTYCYFRKYKNGAILYPHKDREACEVSLSILIGCDKTWKISFGESNTVEYDLDVGDGVLYDGVNVMHWRGVFNGEIMVQVFLHFVRVNGKYSEWAYDKKNYDAYGVKRNDC